MPDRRAAPAAGPVLILTPTGRDAEGAAALLAREGIAGVAYPTLERLQEEVGDATGAVLLADEALLRADLSALAEHVAARPPWSDLPFIVLTQAGFAARRRLAELDLPSKLGNVVFLERPLNAITLVSAVKSALRARQRQRQVRDHLAERVGAAERNAALLEARVAERGAALEAAEAERRKIADALAQAQKMEAVGQLTGGLAHDFNNMLAGIVGSLDLMQSRLAQGRVEQLGRYIGMARLAADRAASLTHRLLAFSRRQALDARPTAADRLIGDMLDLLRSTIGPSIAIEHVPDGALWTTLCDPHQLENALMNLCINARDAMPDGGRLTVATANVRLGEGEAALLREARPGDYVAIGITDTGTGMSPETIARAFDPFFTTKPAGQGTGLGLSMIYGFVQQSGGHVQIGSALGRGTTVRLYLPRHRGEVPSGQAPAAAAATAAGRQGTVLVVDDEPTVRLLIAEVLGDLGYSVLEAADGPAGLQLLGSAPRIDLLVTDVGMPGGMNGRQLAEAARGRRPDLPVLFITGYAEIALTQDGVLGPGMQILTKPFTMAELASKLGQMLG